VSLFLSGENLCPHCGNIIEEGNYFCINCGKDLPVQNVDEKKDKDIEIVYNFELFETQTSEPQPQPKSQSRTFSQVLTQLIGTRSIKGIIGLVMGIISVILSILLLWIFDVTLGFYNPSNLVSYLNRAFSIYAVFLIFTIVGIILSASSKKESIGLSIIGFILGTLALAPQILKLIAIGFYDVVELLRNLYPSYDYYTWEPWVIATFLYLIIAFSISARFFKRILIMGERRKGKIIMQSILWPLVGLVAFATIYLVYRLAMFFVNQFF